MTRLLIFIVLCIVSFLIVKFVIKITSFIIKLIIWLAIIGVVMYLTNYFLLPKFNKRPYDLNTKVVKPVQESTKEVFSEIKDKIEPETKKLKEFVKENIKKIDQKKE